MNELTINNITIDLQIYKKKLKHEQLITNKLN